MFQFPGLPVRTLYIQVRPDGHDAAQVAPFGDLRIEGCVRLPADYRS